MTLAELIDHVADAEHMADALGWEHDDVVVIVTIGHDGGDGITLRHEDMGVRGKLEIELS